MWLVHIIAIAGSLLYTVYFCAISLFSLELTIFYAMYSLLRDFQTFNNVHIYDLRYKKNIWKSPLDTQTFKVELGIG